MRLLDLGDIAGEVVLFGGPYSNLDATRALLARKGARSAICTGDIVAYCGDPRGTVDVMRASGIPIVAGNCEIQLAQNALDCGCGFEEGTACDLLSDGWFAHASSAIDADIRDWMGTLPDLIRFTHNGLRYGVLHGGVSDVARFLWPCSTTEAFQHEIDLLEREMGPVDAVIAGHSGIPFQRQIGHHLWINAGVIGMPPHDGRSETRYAVLSEDGVRFKRLSYDATAASRRMEEVGLIQGYHTSLTSGIWPSEDVLPAEMHR